MTNHSTHHSAFVRISVFEHIARHVASQQDLHAATLVNRNFQRAFSPHLWKSPILKSERAFVSFVASLRSGSQGGKHVRSLSLVVQDSPPKRDLHPFVRSIQECHRRASTSAFANPDNLIIVAKYCSGLQRLTCYGWRLRTHHLETIVLDLRHLQHLVLIGTDHQTSNLSSTVADIPFILPALKTFHLDGEFGLSNQHLSTLGRYGRNIESFQLSSSSCTALGKGLKSLSCLQLFDCPNFTDDDLDRLIQHCTNITSIALADCAALTPLSIKRLLESRLPLQCLDFRMASKAFTVPKPIIINIPNHLELRELFLHNAGLTGKHLSDILLASTKLRCIGLSRCFQLAERSFVSALQSMHALETLHLIECPLIGESALKQIADHHQETLTSLVIDTCGHMHIRSVVHIAKNCTQLRRLGVHGYQHITNSPFHQLSTEYIQGYERNQFSEPMSDTMCSTTFELENLDKLVEASESPWLLENTVAVKSGDEGDVDTGSTLSSVSAEDSDSDSLGMVPSDLPAASAQESGKAGAFIFEYQSAASAYNLAKQVAQTEISSPRILEGWAVEEAEDIEYTGVELYEASPATFMSTSSAYRRPIYSRGYSGPSFSRRPFVSRNSISQHYPSRESPSPSNQWQTDSFGLQAGKSQSGGNNTSTYQDMDTTDWQRDSTQDDSKESESGASQQTDHRGGWRQQPRNPQFYTMEFGNSTEEQQHQYQRPNHTVGDTEKETLQMSESQTTMTSGDVEVEVGEGSTEGWVDYSRWVQASRAETVERHIPSEQTSEYYCSSQSDLTFAADEQKGDVSLLSSPSAVTTNQVTTTDEPVLVDISGSSVSQEVVTGISQVFGDNFDFAALSLQQPFQEENDKAGVHNVVEKKTAQGTLIDLSISDEDDVSICVPKSPYPSSYIEATETRSLSSQTPGLISSDLSCDTMPSVLHTHTSLSPTVTDSGHSDISIPEDVASVLTDDTSASMNAPKPLDLGFLDSSLPKKADHFGFGLEDTKNWLKDLAERQMQSRVA